MSQSRRRFLNTAAGAALGGVFSLPNLSAAVQANSSPYKRPKLKTPALRREDRL